MELFNEIFYKAFSSKAFNISSTSTIQLKTRFYQNFHWKFYEEALNSVKVHLNGASKRPLQRLKCKWFFYTILYKWILKSLFSGNLQSQLLCLKNSRGIQNAKKRFVGKARTSTRTSSRCSGWEKRRKTEMRLQCYWILKASKNWNVIFLCQGFSKRAFFFLAFHLCREIERNSFIVATAPSTMNSSNPWKMIFWMEQLGNFSCAWCCNHFHNALVATTAIPEIWDLPQVFFFIVLAIVSIVQFRFQISNGISLSKDNGFIV